MSPRQHTGHMTRDDEWVKTASNDRASVPMIQRKCPLRVYCVKQKIATITKRLDRVRKMPANPKIQFRLAEGVKVKTAITTGNITIKTPNLQFIFGNNAMRKTI